MFAALTPVNINTKYCASTKTLYEFEFVWNPGILLKFICKSVKSSKPKKQTYKKGWGGVVGEQENSSAVEVWSWLLIPILS